MDTRYSYNMKFKRKRKYNIENSLDNDCSYFNKYDDNPHEHESFSGSSNSSNSTTPLYEKHGSSYDGSSIDESINSELKKELFYSTDKSVDNVSVKGFKRKKKEVEDDDRDTFCVDMGRYKNFTDHAVTPSNGSLFNLYNSSTTRKNSSITSPPYNLNHRNSSNHRAAGHKNHNVHNKSNKNHQSSNITSTSNNNTIKTNNNHTTNKSRSKHQNQIYKQHSHRSGVPASLVPCKGPACRQQICCASFCSQQCFNKQSLPIGSGMNYKSSMTDYDLGNNGQQDIHVTDYGLFYPDHTYCKDHRNVYFTADDSIDQPPYHELVDQLFYNEKETRIKNPRPPGNALGDPIPATGYVPQAKRGRPRRSHLSGLLEPYVYHPSSDVKYNPFVFKESLIDADKRFQETGKKEPIEYAIRTCTNLYKEIRKDIPPHILCTNTEEIHIPQSSPNPVEPQINYESQNFNPNYHHHIPPEDMLHHHHNQSVNINNPIIDTIVTNTIPPQQSHHNHHNHLNDTMLDNRSYDLSMIKSESVTEINSFPDVHFDDDYFTF